MEKNLNLRFMRREVKNTIRHSLRDSTLRD